MKRLITVVAFSLTALGLLRPLEAATNFPYPQSRGYSYGFKPTVGGSDATTIKGYYTAWLGAHLTTAGAGGYARIQMEDKNGDTTSEAISYGMLLAVYFDDQSTFDKLWSYKQLHNDGLGLMNWWIASGGGTSGGNSAADADQDIAYALYLAYYQWGTAASGSSSGTSYKTLADAELLKVTAYDLDSNRIKPGDAYNACRYPSYFFPNEYKVFGKQSGDTTTWNAVAANCYNTIAAARNGSTGILAEQCTDTGQGGGCQASDPSTQDKYNSSRVPLRMAMAYVYYGDAQASSELALLNSNNGFGGIGPSSVVDCYNVGNSPLSGATCSSNAGVGAFFGPAGTTFMQSGSGNLNTYYNYMVSNFNSAQYFNGAIQLLSLLLMSGNMPNIADQGAMFTPTRTQTPGGPTPTVTPTPTALSFAYIFEDFEHAMTVNDYKFAGPTTPGTTPTPVISYAVSNAQAQSGTFSQKINVQMVTGTYCGNGFDSTYAPATTGVMDMTGAVTVRLAVMTDKLISITVNLREGKGVGRTGDVGDDEVYSSAAQAVPANAGVWQIIAIPITGFTENIYNNSCAPNCTTTGNNKFNLSSIKACEIDYSGTIGTVGAPATVYIDQVAFLPGVLPTLTPTKTPFPNPYNIIYDDFENANSLISAPKRVTTFADTANLASAAFVIDSTTVASGAHSGRLNYNLGTAGVSYGCGGSFLSPYDTINWTSPSALVGQAYDASNAVSISYWINAPAGLVYQLTYQEAGVVGSPVGASDGEAWFSNYLTGTGAWQRVTVDIGDMAEDPYNIECNPSSTPAPGPCMSTGNNTRDANAVWQVGLKLPGQQVGVASRTGSVYLDDVQFITTFRSPTITPTYTGGVPSNTPTPSPTATRTPTPTTSSSPSSTASPSPTLTASPTATLGNSATDTPTISPSGTASSTRSPTVTVTSSPTTTPTRTATATGTPAGSPTVTATATQFNGSPTITETFSVTPSITPSVTLTSSGTPTDTATLTNTVAPSKTSTPTNTVGIPSITVSASASPSVTLSNTPAIFSPTVSPTVTSSSTNVVFSPTVTPTATPSSTNVVFSPTVTNTPAVPVLGSLAPTVADSAGGTVITLTGTNFLPGATVQINGVTVASTYVSATQITVTVPAESVGTVVPVTVTNPDGTPSLVQNLSIKLSTPTVTPSITLSNTPLPTGSVTLTATRTVTLTQTLTYTPTATPDNTAVVTPAVTPPPPSISNVTPLQAAAGDTVTVTGNYFVSGATVMVQGDPSSIPATVISPTQITFVMPALGGSASSAILTLTNPDGQSVVNSVGVKHVSPSATPGGAVIVTTQPVPNPGTSANPPVVVVELGVGADSLSLKIYSKSLVLVAKVTTAVTGSGISGHGWQSIQVPSLDPGMYFYTVSAVRSGTTIKGTKVGRFFIFK